jgi:mono/diheme cytochrome c family protein
MTPTALSSSIAARLIVAAVAMTGTLSAAAAQTARPNPPSVLIDSLAGRDSFERYCAACHGSDGRGNGPVASALRTRPADLTLLARRNNGAFPRQPIRDFITGVGRPVPAHGTSEMPVWGPMFGVFEPQPRVRERIGNLVTYIETLQQPSTGAENEGRRLFLAHCAGCHGADARGAGPFAATLPHMPPDLTQFTRRNGGMFPRERVYRIIDGRDVPTHVDRDMPVWGTAFKSQHGGTDAAHVKARIDAIVRYLEGIQERSGD